MPSARTAGPGKRMLYADRKGIWKSVYACRAFYVMALPGLLYFLIFHYTPMAGLLIAFKDFSPISGFSGIFTSPWVGMDHFERFFSSFYFNRVVANTVIISALKLVFGIPAPILLALLITEVMNTRYKRFIQTISYLPHFLSWVVVAGLLHLLLSPSFGVVNDLIAALGMERIFFLGSNEHFRWVLVGNSIWKEAGWSSIIYLAAIAGINPDLYEAAEMDGASRFRQAISITLPSIRNIISIIFILNMGHLLEAGFEQVFLLYSPQVYEVADIIDTYVYREGLLQVNYSFAAAVGLFKSVIAGILIIGANALARKLEAETLW